MIIEDVGCDSALIVVTHLGFQGQADLEPNLDSTLGGLEQKLCSKIQFIHLNSTCKNNDLKMIRKSKDNICEGFSTAPSI